MTSDPDDPHGWSFDCEVLPLAKTTMNKVTKLKAWWVCRLCRTTVRVWSEVVIRPHSGNEAYDEMAALSELAVRANVERGKAHPRCSEIRLVKDVMDT